MTTIRDYEFRMIVSAENIETAIAIANERIMHDEEYPELGNPEYEISVSFVK